MRVTSTDSGLDMRHTMLGATLRALWGERNDDVR